MDMAISIRVGDRMLSTTVPIKTDHTVEEVVVELVP